jgi:predicted TIM-barrel fold metal-dependent hydrolase
MVIEKRLEPDLPPLPPIPTQVVSNGEYIPLPKTRQQREVDHRLLEYADRYGKPRGLSRRRFLQTASGFAAAMLAMNKVYGHCFFDVAEVEAADEMAAVEAALKKRKGSQFILDDQTHWLNAAKLEHAKTERGKIARDFLMGFRNSVLPGSKIQDIGTQEAYVKQIFLESETTMSIISGVPAAADDDEILLPIDNMVATRDFVNAKAGTRRMLSHGLVAPNDPRNLEMMEWQAKDLKVDSWKGYTSDGISGRYPKDGHYGGWYLDDVKVAYPMYDKMRKLGVRNFCIHKGLAVIWFDTKYCRLDDLEPAALANPDINFIVYHSGYPWVDDLANIPRFKRNPALNVANNIYAELGSTFALTVTGAPLEAAHVMGKLITHVGADRIVWGTDSTWWGSPQWQIDAFRRFQIPEEIQKGFGYKPITDKDKDMILGLNSARLYGLDVTAMMDRLARDEISTLRAAVAPELTTDYRRYVAAAGVPVG